MVNVVLNKDASYTMAFSAGMKKFGPGEQGNRMVVDCEIYAQTDDTGRMFMTKGMAILNPLDKFDERIGFHKALASALTDWFADPAERKVFHDTLDGWYQN